MSERLEKLAALAEMVRDAELSRLRQLQAVRYRAENAVRDLNAAQKRVTLEAAPDPAYRSGSDGRWLVWAMRRQRALAEQSAQAAADAEAQKLRARRALGRAEVLAQLARRA